MGLNVHVYPSPLTHESRILRSVEVIERLGRFEKIIVVGVAGPGLPDEEAISERILFKRIPRKFFANSTGFIAKILKTIEWSVRTFHYASSLSVTCVSAHSLAVLPLCAAIKARTGAILVYDTHELETEVHHLQGARKSIAKVVERSAIRSVDETIVVSDSIGVWYRETYPSLDPVTVRNLPATPHVIGTLSKANLRALLGLNNTDILFLYQGGLISGRGIERLLRLFAAMPPHLHIAFLGDGPLSTYVESCAAEHVNIHRLSAVPPLEVVHYTRSADIGVCLTEKSCLSHEYSLPNKLFEYLLAGIPVIVPDLAEQRAIVEPNGFGWVLDTDDTHAAAFLSALSRTDIEARKKAVQTQGRHFSWDEERSVLEAFYRTRVFPRIERKFANRS